MISAWYKHLTSLEEQDKFKNAIRGSKVVLSRLGELVQELEDKQERTETDPKVYENSDWAFKQAHKNGYRNCLNDIKKLIDLDQEN
jgi:hypothetical protein